MSFTGKNPKFDSTILVDQGVTSVANPAASSVKLIVRSGGLVLKNSAGTETTASAQTSPTDVKNYSLTCTVGSSALTVALKDSAGADPTAGSPVNIAFRNATQATGDYTVVSVTAALSVVVSSGSTLGHVNAVAYPIYVYALNNAGTVELAVSTTLYPTEKITSTTAEGGAGAADSLNAIYSTTARSNKAIKLIGKLISTQTTAGTWAAVPTTVDVAGVLDCPASNVMGTTTNDAALARYIGEFLDSYVSGVNTNNTGVNITSLSLTPGDWDVSGVVHSDTGGSDTGYIKLAINTTSASIAGSLGKDLVLVPTIVTAGYQADAVIPRLRFSLAATTTIYLNAATQNNVSATANGYLTARRVR